jgi:hypothetical protein
MSRRCWGVFAAGTPWDAEGAGCAGTDCAWAIFAAASEKIVATVAKTFRFAGNFLFTIHPALAYSADRKYSRTGT